MTDTPFALASEDPNYQAFSSHQLCPKCESIFVQVRLDDSSQRYGGNHYESLPILKQSAIDGCKFCGIILGGLPPNLLERVQDPTTAKDAQLLKWRMSAPQVPAGTWFAFFSQGETDISEFHMRRMKKNDVPPKNPLSESASTGSEISLAQAQRWLTTCTTHHSACIEASSSDWLPTRLLDVGSFVTAREIRLCLRDEIPLGSRYLTLSHCWGSFLTLKLTGAYLAQFRTGIPMSSLPKTYQDAVHTARSLGYRYLWIDSLCIIQDSVEDWLKECSVMGLVYKNGLCNIAAAAAKDGTEGCFSQKDPAFFGTMIVRSMPARSSSEDYLVLGPHCTEHLGRYDQPLYSRGWVIQEWFLATRVLHFGRTMIFWECQHGIASEASPVLDEPERAVVGHLPKTVPETSGTPFNDLMFYWSDLVTLYTQAKFTRKEDKLPAFSGIAKEIGARLQLCVPQQIEYLAGLWSKCLAQQLLWSAFWVGDEARQPDHGRPEIYRAPSWSWASTDYHVMPPRCREGAERNVLIKVVDYHISPVSDDTYLQVKSGHLQVRCWLWRLKEQERNDYAITSPFTRPNGVQGENGTFSYDEVTALPISSWPKAINNGSKADVFLMPVLQGAYRFEEHPGKSPGWKAEILLSGLILTKVSNGPGQFQRVGTFSLKKIWVELQEDISPSLVLTDCDLRPSMHHILQQIEEQLLIDEVHGLDSGDYEERHIDLRFGAQEIDHLSKYLYTITIL